MATYLEIAKTNEKVANDQLAVVRKSLKAKKLDEYTVGMTKLQTAVQELNKCVCNVEYDKFMHAENPMIAAVKQFYIEVFKVKEERDKGSGAVVDVKFERKKARIDLEKLCEFGRLSKEWAHDAAKLLALLTLRETDVFAIKPADLVKKSYYFISGVQQKQDGKTPDSNRQIVILLQKIIDEAIFVDDGSGNNTYKCTNHDIAFIQDAVTKMDTKEKCTIAMLNERQFKTVMMSVFAHCLGEAYCVRGAKPKTENA